MQNNYHPLQIIINIEEKFYFLIKRILQKRETPTLYIASKTTMVIDFIIVDFPDIFGPVKIMILLFLKSIEFLTGVDNFK